METLYNPQGVEERWQRTWEDEGLYAADPARPGETFVVAHPPPNVTGELHVGHALQISLADALVRWHRMRGFNTAFLTGYDHAGISTQNAVEKHLATQGQKRQELGRERFEEVVWDWLRQYGRTIMTQFRRIGASMDYRRERFTMDDAYVRAVYRFFVHLYRKGWIYRANRIINWCPFHETSLSDLELVHEDVDDALTYVRYPFADGDGHITIATVRPATILADVAVAVHPEDDRYRDLVGAEVVVPFVERRVPVIADDRVEIEFGTGALKITPGHDPTDFEIGRDHGLPDLAVIGPGIDPEEALEPYGADATRYGLLKMTTGQDPRFSWGTIEEGRKLANKLWNASRLLLMAGVAEADARPSSVEERWILARIDATRAEFEAHLAAFDFAHAVQRIYHLTFDDFCDWYL